MYIQKIYITVNSDYDTNELIDEFGLLMSFYRGSGQTQGKIESQYFSDNVINALPYTLEKDSLDTKNNNHYVNKQIDKIESLCNSKIKISTQGTCYSTPTTVCTCPKPDYYILTTNYLSIDSPITCGGCNKSVPLYQLPKYYDYGYMPILSWESNYQSADTLQMNCEIGERWALNQMQEVDSALTKQGLNICKKIEELTGIPTYYFLHNYKKERGDVTQKKCPKCKNQWHLKEPLHDFYDYKCDNCKLLSLISPNS